MPRATCRCGQELSVPPDQTERIVCPRCGAKVRVRPKPPADDGFIRFSCPCGRRLKVEAAGAPAYGKCPDCGEVIPIPPPGTTPGGSAFVPGFETRTAEMDAVDAARLEQWSQGHAQKRAAAAGGPSGGVARGPSASSVARGEAGLRVCPNCRKPIHLGADACRHCGTHVPKR